MKDRVRDSSFQPTGMDIGRTSRLFALSKVIPLGNWGGGPGWRCLVILWLSHNFGRIFFWIFVRYERELSAVFRRIRPGCHER